LFAAGTLLATGVMAVAATLELGDPQPVTDTTANVPMRLAGSAGVVALQFDVSFPPALASFATPSLTTVVAQKHKVSFREVQPGLLRVVLASAANAVLPQDLILDLPMLLSAGTAAEVPLLRLFNIWFAGSSGQMIPAIATYGPVTAWKRLNFTLTELSDPAISGDAADPEGDTLPNLVELLLNGRAKLADRARVPELQMLTNPQDGKAYLTLTYRQWKGARGVAGEVQSSTDLATWPGLVPAAPTGVEDAETMEMRASVAIEGQERMFLRLRAKRVPVP
jgi:hypothetical protein